MAVSDDYLAYVQELLGDAVGARYRKMFGGVGIFEGDSMFGLITSDEELFFKVDDATRPRYEAEGSRPFLRMPYFLVPAAALEDRAQLAELAREAVAVAHAAPKKPKKTKRTKRPR